MPSWTNRREPAQQTCPWLNQIASTRPSTAAVDICVIENNVGGFAAELQGEGFARSSGGFADDSADLGGASEGNFIDLRCDEGRARFTVACDDVHDTSGHASLVADFGKDHRGERREFGGFEDDGVAHRQGGRDFPCEHQEREVPWDDLTADAQGLGVGQFLVHELRHACVVVEVADRQRHVDVAGFADRLPVIQGFHDGEEARVFLHQARDGVEDAGAGVAVFGPCGLCLASGFDGECHFFGGAFGDACEFDARCGVCRGEVVAQVTELTVDIVTSDASTISDPSERLFAAFGGRAVVHGVENIFNCHGLIQSRAATGQNNCL